MGASSRPGPELGIVALLHRDRRRLLPALCAVFFPYGYFVGPPAWNQNSRFALTRALVETGTTAIDPYHHTTGDKSWREGHFYSDKAPGASLLALPAYALAYGISRASGGELAAAEIVPIRPPIGEMPDDAQRPTTTSPDENSDDKIKREPGVPKEGERLHYNRAYRLALYLCRLLSTSLLAVFGIAALYLLALYRLHDDRRGALAIALIYGLGTPAFVYSTALYGHQLAADCLLIALAAIVYARRPSHYLAAGTCLGWAVLCEYTAAVPVVILLLTAFLLGGRRGALFTALGGLPWAGLLGLYHWAAFGSPLKTGYDFVYLTQFAEGMEVHYGIAAPDLGVLYNLLFSSYRGLFYLAPVLLLAAWGLVVDSFDRRLGAPKRTIAAVSLLICLYFVLLNAGYYMWDGGAAFGPRHCVPMLPFLCLGLAPALREVPRLLALLALVSIAQMTLGAAGSPEAPQHGNPLWGHAWPRLRDAVTGSYGSSTNLGLLLGLPGWLSLLPLAALWLGIGRDLRESDTQAQATSDTNINR
ncbi:MAG TPA: hypothetical protein ENK31_08435 [Nannocystis exedens]|nr:hypothetical protein [Nannocystis exedens]